MARLFADDCILYRQIYNHEDSITLQQDLDNLAAWEKMWGMQFHPEKILLLKKAETHFQVFPLIT
jgi:anthranilate/para-aminobenzoate synthase component II